MSSARTLERRSGLNAAGDRFGFFAVHANGEGALGAFRHWNAGHCCAEAMWRRRDDVGFVRRVIDDVSEHVRVDPERVYLVGFSNGGMLAWRFAAEHAERVAGVVPIAATVAGALERDDPYGRLPRPSRPVPLMLFRGADDRRTPALHAEASLAHWAERNGCAPQPEVRSLREGALQVREWSDCAPGAAVSAVELEDWRHRWPGRHFSRRRRDALRDFDGVDLWWPFFESQRAQAGR
jgi:polyhydroxybutyrate depolymerase